MLCDAKITLARMLHHSIANDIDDAFTFEQWPPSLPSSIHGDQIAESSSTDSYDKTLSTAPLIDRLRQRTANDHHFTPQGLVVLIARRRRWTRVADEATVDGGAVGHAKEAVPDHDPRHNGADRHLRLHWPRSLLRDNSRQNRRIESPASANAVTPRAIG